MVVHHRIGSSTSLGPPDNHTRGIDRISAAIASTNNPWENCDVTVVIDKSMPITCLPHYLLRIIDAIGTRVDPQ